MDYLGQNRDTPPFIYTDVDSTGRIDVTEGKKL